MRLLVNQQWSSVYAFMHSLVNIEFKIICDLYEGLRDDFKLNTNSRDAQII